MKTKTRCLISDMNKIIQKLLQMYRVGQKLDNF